MFLTGGSRCVNYLSVGLFRFAGVVVWLRLDWCAFRFCCLIAFNSVVLRLLDTCMSIYFSVWVVFIVCFWCCLFCVL